MVPGTIPPELCKVGKKVCRRKRGRRGGIRRKIKHMSLDDRRRLPPLPKSLSGNVLTPLWEELANQTENPAATIKAGEEAQLIGRMGTETECGLAALFLAADASFCTGVELLVSGGAELNLARKTQIS
ncbi:hypothetical protein GJAV_G00216860 [Gymnothorax javanicus]|nr:hypothetical protein GJAV_G00216860 [Gymnothorax javanicus]